MKIKALTFILISTLCSHILNSSEQSPVQIYLFAGQSNMSGTGGYEALDPAAKERVADAAQSVSLSVSGKAATHLTYYTSKHHQEKYGITKAFGPELFAGVSLAEAYPEKEFLLIKTSQGGTSLYGAWNPNWSEAKAKEMEKGFKQNLKLYAKHLENIQTNLQRLEAAGKSYEIVGMFWMQGENDASREVSARSYEANLQKLIQSYRDTLNLPGLPFVIGQINSTYGNFPDGPSIVRQAMVDVSENDPQVALVRTSTDPSWSDFPKHKNVHYNTIGQQRLGTAFAEAMMRLHE